MTRELRLSLHDIADVTEQLAELRTTADDILTRMWSVGDTRALLDSSGPAYDADLWKEVVALGWADVLVDESQGGGGGGMRELCVLAEASGAAALPVPLAATAAANWCEARCVSGVAAILGEADAVLSGDEVTGRWSSVPFAGVADRLLVIARGRGETVLGIVDADGPGVRRELERPLDHSPAATVTLDGAPLRLLASGADAVRRHHDAMSRARLATVAELIGIASAANDAAVEYAKMRVTFGQPIGARQAVKHRLVDQRCSIEVARALANRAADACELEHPDRDALVSLAVFWAIDSLRRVPEGATQVFGGIAYTWEHDAHVHLRRAATAVSTLGSRAEHRAVVKEWIRTL
ncbi:acyl-CoA dehydrogenase family protein [Mycolicibacterium sp. BiH015]|uniref:acyl-CoA dehydrogenase family protein n=1 Tax=Mycolicibacterium sp. BiH015 TaxID=3018808 RepID=UPI0022DFCFB4|nr:acyl-CoA dehydrogenase family protein [Mycolicibacterium sp. BiH015]MDA2894916.1 acyl-CoA dehydrogenase family protein [Mycolicibacterium sp. BiH015]